jgi:hypothetical protein
MIHSNVSPVRALLPACKIKIKNWPTCLWEEQDVDSPLRCNHARRIVGLVRIYHGCGAERPARAGRRAHYPRFKPAMDDLMTMLVQPRHIKLYSAGQAKNWRLAGFELNELRGALARIGRTIPTYRNIGVDTAVASIFADTIKSVDAAIKAGDPAQFATAYGEMTAACNSCHVGIEHPFLVIKVPDAANYPDQEFRP